MVGECCAALAAEVQGYSEHENIEMERWGRTDDGHLTRPAGCVCGRSCPVRRTSNIFTLLRKYFWNIFSLGYDTEYTETDRKDIQNLAQEIETKYNNYGEGIANKFANWEPSPTVQSCGRRWSTRLRTRCRAAAWRCAWTGAWTSCSAGPRPVKTTSTCHTMLTRRRTPAGTGDINRGRYISMYW